MYPMVTSQLQKYFYILVIQTFALIFVSLGDFYKVVATEHTILFLFTMNKTAYRKPIYV